MTYVVDITSVAWLMAGPKARAASKIMRLIIDDTMNKDIWSHGGEMSRKASR
jgi:hypothetical protein